MKKNIFCKKCLVRLEQDGDVYRCPVCGYTKPRIIRLQPEPLFLNVEVKGEDTKKFLDSLFVPRKQKMDIKDNGVVFIRSPEGTIVEVTTIEKLCDKLAKEIRGQ